MLRTMRILDYDVVYKYYSAWMAKSARLDTEYWWWDNGKY